LCVEKGDLKTFELLKIKSVTAIALFAVLMVGASVYTMHKTALADAAAEADEPECTVLFNPDAPEVTVGETFTVTVFVDDVKDLYGFEIGLVFNREVIEYVGAKTPHWRFIGGKLEWIFWVAGIIPQNGEVKLMEFTFKGIAKGSSSLSLSVHKLATSKYWEIPHDYVGWPIPHIVSEGLVTVS
jgi:hypothetical protein